MPSALRTFLPLALLALAAASHAKTEDVISLALPIRCQPGVNCFVQNYLDHDTSEKARDFRCGARTYNGHDGTDIRIRNLEIQRQGVEVLAAAPGRVVGMRNDMEDVSVRIVGKAAVAGKECGNGAVIEHDGGWRTQYCHMAKGSVRIKPGDRIATEQPIGLVGLSGDTEFFHLHFTVRYRGKAVDPFAYGASEDSCGGGRSLWAAALVNQMQYRPREIIDFGFTGINPTMDLVESGKAASIAVMPNSDALVAYVRTIGLQTGDQQFLSVQGPDGAPFAAYNPAALDADKAQFLISTGRKRTEPAWSAGIYTATYRVMRDGTEVLRKTFDVETGAR